MASQTHFYVQATFNSNSPHGLNVEGIANIKGTSGPNVWRMVPRRMLVSHQSAENWQVENTNKEWTGNTDKDTDVIMLVKEAISSQRLSQQPLLALPEGLSSTLDIQKLEVASNHSLSSREKLDTTPGFM